MSKVAAVIATYNRERELSHCLESLVRQELSASDDLVVYVVDDGSKDATPTVVRSHRGTKLIRLEGNFWWAGASNIGAFAAISDGADYVFLLNPDSVPRDNGTLDSLLQASQATGGIVASVVVHEPTGGDSRIWWAGSRWVAARALLPIRVNRYIPLRGCRIEDQKEGGDLSLGLLRTDEVHGRGVLVPSRIFEDLGGFDSAVFPQYGADVDFSLRAMKAGIDMRVHLGAAVVLTPETTSLKPPDTSTPVKGMVRAVLRYLFYRKYGEAVRVWWRLSHRHQRIGLRSLAACLIVGWNVRHLLRRS